MGNEENRADSGQQSGWHKENGSRDMSGRENSYGNDNTGVDAAAGDHGQSQTGNPEQFNVDNEDQHGNSADHFSSASGKNWSDHDTAAFESDQERNTMRGDSNDNSGDRQAPGQSQSSDYIDADDDKDLKTQSGTFFDDEDYSSRQDDIRGTES